MELVNYFGGGFSFYLVGCVLAFILLFTANLVFNEKFNIGYFWCVVGISLLSWGGIAISLADITFAISYIFFKFLKSLIIKYRGV